MGQVASEIAREAGIRMHRVGRSELLGRDGLESFLEACKRAEGLIVGIEGFGFRLIGDRIEPDMEWIADFSELSDPAESVSEAREFLEAAPNDLLLRLRHSPQRSVAESASPGGCSRGVHALPFEVFSCHLGRADSLESNGFRRLGAICGDTRSTLVMKGSPVRVRGVGLPDLQGFLRG